MLYERWRQVAQDNRHETALWDLPSGRRWTFAQLLEAGEKTPAPGQEVVFPSGQSADFILDLLQAWRHGVVTCPLEAGQAVPHLKSVPAACVHLKLTSATTGPARMLHFGAESLAADPQNIVTSMGLRADWPNLGVISLVHSYGFSNLVLPLLLHGIPLILAGNPFPETVRRAGDLFPHLTLPAVPALWRTWLEAKTIPPTVRLAISAGAHLPLALEQGVYEQQGLKLHNFYGSSECGGIAFDGSATPRQEVTLAGAPMHRVKVSCNGERCLEVRGPAVGEGYWPERDETLEHGCFRTRDLAELRDHQVYLVGRAGDLMNVAGRKISPEAVEQSLRTHPEAGECAVFGIPSTSVERGDTIVACYSGPASAAVLREYLLHRLPAWQVPREWWQVPELSANQRGKISRSDWRRRFLVERG